MAKAHVAEVFCQSVFALNKNAIDLTEKFYSDRDSFDIPEWCDLPMAFTYAILTDGAPVNIAPQILASKGENTLPNLTAALVWNKTKAVYRYDSTLKQELLDQPLEGKIPIEALFKTPYPCIFIEDEFIEGSTGFFAWIEYDIHNKMPELRLLYLLEAGQTVSIPVLLSGGTLDDSYTAFIKSGVERSGIPLLVEGSDSTKFADIAKNSINLLLYLCSAEPDGAAAKDYGIRRPTDHRGHIKRSYTWDVGTRIGAALRKAQEQSETRINDTEIGKSQLRSSPRPHMRRAHWHSFWRGPKDDRELVLRWLPPTAVNMDGEETPVVVFPVE